MPINSHKKAIHREEILHGDVKKLDTQIVYQYNVEPRVLSGFVDSGLAELEFQKNLKGTVGIMNNGSILLAKTNPNKGNKIAQAPKQEYLRAHQALNPDNRGTRDATASEDLKSKMRTRNQHSIATPSEKAGSVENSISKGEILELLFKRNQLYRLVLKELTKYKTKDEKYNGCLCSRIINPMMLQACYSLIQSKPGNMTSVNENSYLDVIDMNWFEKTVKDIQEGRYQFSLAKQILIPKPNKPGEFRPQLTVSPRDKIVQKALQVLLHAIFEPQFSKSLYELRPKRVLNGLHHQLNTKNKRGGRIGWGIAVYRSKCIEIPPHAILFCVRGSIKERITCACLCSCRKLTLIERVLQTGFKDDKGINVKTKIGSPASMRGCCSILSPLLSNIVLDKLDKYIESLDSELNVEGSIKNLKPACGLLEDIESSHKSSSCSVRATEDAYACISRKKKKRERHNEDFRRVSNCRDSDYFIVLDVSTRTFAIFLKEEIEKHLKDECGFELNAQKNREGLTDAIFKKQYSSRACLRETYSQTKSNEGIVDKKITRRTTIRMGVEVPIKLLIENLIKNDFARRNHLAKVLAKGKTDMIH